MSRFNLINEKWIPVRLSNGNRSELGILDTLLRSKEIEAIEDPSPLVVAALHRFLLAVLYRALAGPTDIDQARSLLNEGLPDDIIKAYLEDWRDRFWLFDDTHPFYQIPNYEPQIKKGKKSWRSWSAIAAEHNADNAKVLFDHFEIAKPAAIHSSKAAQWLIACQSFSLGGGKSDFRYTKSAPSATAVMVLPLGVNLHDTLILSLVPENREVLQADIPIWERDPETLDELQRGTQRNITGFADLYTWRTRAIKFNILKDGTVIRELAFASGVEFSVDGHIDPMFGYRIDTKKGKLPIQFRERGIWRDYDSLLPDKSSLAPLVIDHATSLTRPNRDRFPRSVMILGQANNKAKIKYWRMERFALPGALVGNRFIRTEIRGLLGDAEETQKSLWNACRLYARDILSRGERNPSEGDINGFVDQMPMIPWYWSNLEAKFHEILSGYTLDRDPDEIRSEWLKSVRDTLMAAWEMHRLSVSTGDAWAIRALVKSEAQVLRKLKVLNVEIITLEPKEEVA